MQNVFTLPLWGRWHDFGVTDEVVVYSGRQGSEAKPPKARSRQSRRLAEATGEDYATVAKNAKLVRQRRK